MAVRLVSVDGGSRDLTAGEIADRANDYAAAIAARVDAGSSVSICLYHGAELYAAFIGALWAGAVPMMLPPPSPRIDRNKYVRSFRHMVEYVAPALIVVDGSTAPALSLVTSESARHLHVLTPSEVTRASGKVDIAASKPEDIALLQHSSGTTGLQKGVALSNGAILAHNAAYSSAISLVESDVIVSWLPLYHDMGFVACFLLPLTQGVEVVAMSPFDWVRRPIMLLERISQHRGTLCWMPNFAFALLARIARLRKPIGELDLSSIRAWINSSEPVRAAAQDAFVETFSRFGVSATQLTASYAMAENVYAVTQSLPDSYRTLSADAREFREGHRAMPVAAGFSGDVTSFVSNGAPVAGTEVVILDSREDSASDGVVGEIAIRGKYLFSGYYKRPDLTDAAMTPDGWYRTGDLGFVHDGDLYVTGRLKDLIIVQGRNFYPADIEAVACVAGIVPGRVVAFGIRDDTAGTEGIVILGERDEGSGLSPDAIIADVRKQVAQEFDCTPAVVRLVPERWLVKSSSGKLARADNRAKFAAESSTLEPAAIV